MATDRPDTTESPITVDAGHVQAELSLIEFVHDHDGGERADDVSVLPTNLKIGVGVFVGTSFRF